MQGLVNYINDAGAAKGMGGPIDLWFFWCFNDNSPE